MADAKSGFTPSFHIAGSALVVMGIGASVLSLFWDVLVKGVPFRSEDIGPLNIVGVVAGLVIVNIGTAAGFLLARRTPGVRQWPPGRKMHAAFLFSGVILLFSGPGGMVVSLFWDVIGRGRPFSAGAIGPFKVAGILAGAALLAVGIVLVFLGGRMAPASKPRAMEPSRAAVTNEEEIPVAMAVPAGPERPRPEGRPMEAIPFDEPGPAQERRARL